MIPGRLAIGWMVLAGLVAAELSAGDYRLHCRRAGGYYAWLDAVERDGIVTVDANQGYSYELAKQLQLPGDALTRLRFELPATDCTFSQADPLLLECHSRDVRLGFRGEKDVAVTAGTVGLFVARVEEETVRGRFVRTRTVLSVDVEKHSAQVEEEFPFPSEVRNLPVEGCTNTKLPEEGTR